MTLTHKVLYHQIVWDQHFTEKILSNQKNVINFDDWFIKGAMMVIVCSPIPR